MNNLRIGIGIDAHPFIDAIDASTATLPGEEAGDRAPRFNSDHSLHCLVLGGVPFTDHPRLLAHSDGDVLIHALMDALLSAARQPSIGELFPDTSSEYQSADSTILLSEVLNRITQAKFSIVDVDCVVSAKTPHIAGHTQTIRQSLADLLQISVDKVGLKGTSLNGLGEVGAGQAVQAHAVVILCQNESDLPQ